MQKTWEDIEKEHARLTKNEGIASEIIAWSLKVSRAKDLAIVCLTVALIVSILKLGGKSWKN